MFPEYNHYPERYGNLSAHDLHNLFMQVQALGNFNPAPPLRMEFDGTAWHISIDPQYLSVGSSGVQDLTASQNDYQLNYTTTYLTANGDYNITGLTGGADNAVYTIINSDTANTLTLVDQSGSSTAANRIVTQSGEDLPIPPGYSVTVKYDPTLARWVAISGSAIALYEAAAVSGVSTAYPGWVKVTKAYTDTATANTTNTITLYTLPAKGVVSGAIIKHTTAWAGGALATVTATVLINGSPTATGFDVMQATGDTVFQNATTTGFNRIMNFGSTNNIQLQMDSTGANLDAATQGSLDVYLLISTLP
jgi:hypothetical protein